MNAVENLSAFTPGSTSSTLLALVKEGDAEAWSRLARLYGPTVYAWARRAKLQPADAADVVQEVFRAVATHVAGFRREQPGDSFRGWLWVITRNQIRDHFRNRADQPQGVGGSSAQVRCQEWPEPLPADSQSSSPETSRLARRALDLIRIEFDSPIWQAFWRYVVEGETPADVAQDLGLSVWSVYKAKSRVLQRLREELGDWLE
jgi:RNA polymerase sigma-70 factor (ECF subfamily)